MPQTKGLINRGLPTFTADGSNAQVRLGRYGELIQTATIDPIYREAEAGDIFYSLNATIGTGQLAAIQTTWSATNALLTVYNRPATDRAKRVYPLWLRLINTVIPASSTSVQGAITIDSIIRMSSGAVTFNPEQKRGTNMDKGTLGNLTTALGPATLTAAASVRQVGRFNLMSVIPTQFLEIQMFFGSQKNISGSLGSGNRLIANTVPIGIGNNQSMNVHVWYPGNATTTGQWEFEFIWMER
jgi:hypothetical protein